MPYSHRCNHAWLVAGCRIADSWLKKEEKMRGGIWPGRKLYQSASIRLYSHRQVTTLCVPTLSRPIPTDRWNSIERRSIFGSVQNFMGRPRCSTGYSRKKKSYVPSSFRFGTLSGPDIFWYFCHFFLIGRLMMVWWNNDVSCNNRSWFSRRNGTNNSQWATQWMPAAGPVALRIVSTEVYTFSDQSFCCCMCFSPLLLTEFDTDFGSPVFVLSKKGVGGGRDAHLSHVNQEFLAFSCRSTIFHFNSRPENVMDEGCIYMCVYRMCV